MNFIQKLFKNNEVKEIAQQITQNEESSELQTQEQLPQIKVRDIKAHLVNEFELSKKQQENIEYLENIIEELKITETKYKASLVTLEEYSSRLQRKDAVIGTLKLRISDKNYEIDDLNEQINNLKINQYQKEEYRKEVVRDTKARVAEMLITKVDEHKGVLPKDTLKEWLENLDLKAEE